MHNHSPKQDPQRWVQDHPTTGKPFDKDVRLGAPTAFAIGIVLISVLTLIGMWYLLGGYENTSAERDATLPPRAQQTLPPEPRLQVHAEKDLQAFLAEQNAHLQSFGWVDQSQDRGHIAVEAAMELIADQGMTVRRNRRHYEDPLLWRDPTLSHLREEEH